MRARADEGMGLVVVTLIVVVRGVLPRLPGRIDVAAMASTFREIVPPPRMPVIALEVVWSPAEENDRMSSAELEVLYPELLRVDDAADVGRTICGYCNGVYPAEIGKCPACGAPRPAPTPQA